MGEGQGAKKRFRINRQTPQNVARRDRADSRGSKSALGKMEKAAEKLLSQRIFKHDVRLAWVSVNTRAPAGWLLPQATISATARIPTDVHGRAGLSGKLGHLPWLTVSLTSNSSQGHGRFPTR